MQTDNSSLISEVYYDDESLELTLVFRKYYVSHETYLNVHHSVFNTFSEQKSLGKFYLNYIKLNHKLKTEVMSRPKTINKASDEKRYIKMSLNVREINKAWIEAGEKGDYLNITLSMLPDGDTDKYGNLGMITQDVPKSVREKEKSFPKEKKTKGNILGNGCEFPPFVPEGTPGEETGKLITEKEMDDLPF